MDRSRIAILIPAFREAATIGSIVRAAREHAEVIVVDDASPDETGAEAARAGAIVIRNETNLGYDGTLNRAFEEALARGFAYAITMDADGEHDPALVASFKSLLADEGMPLVLGVRPHKQRFAEIVPGPYVRLRFVARDIPCAMQALHLMLASDTRGFAHTDPLAASTDT